MMNREPNPYETLILCSSVALMDLASSPAGDNPPAIVAPPSDLAPSDPSRADSPRSSGDPLARLRVREITTEDRLAAIAEQWNSLAADVPFRTFDWLVPWWRHFRRPAASLFVLGVEDQNGQLRGLAPWYIESTTGRGRVIQFLGTGEVCSDYLTVLSQPGYEQLVAVALCEWLCGEGGEAWDLIELIGVEAGDPCVSALVEQFAARDHTIHQQPGMDCWRVALSSTWDAFLDTLHSSRRAKVRQALRKHFDNGQAVVRLLTHPSELERRFEMFVDLHQRRRHGLGQPGCFASRPFSDFHREISRRFFAAGKLRLLWTELAGRPIAAEYGFVGGDTVYYYQTGIEPEAIKVGPGWIGMIGSLKQAIEAGYRNFDFLRGDEAYKTSWGARPRAMLETRIVARRASARLRHAIWLARGNVRNWMKHGFHFSRRIVTETD
jgi:CelD/BcsL family acetyltransferase involved in cellulose biosynthesis